MRRHSASLISRVSSSFGGSLNPSSAAGELAECVLINHPSLLLAEQVQSGGSSAPTNNARSHERAFINLNHFSIRGFASLPDPAESDADRPGRGPSVSNHRNNNVRTGGRFNSNSDTRTGPSTSNRSSSGPNSNGRFQNNRRILGGENGPSSERQPQRNFNPQGWRERAQNNYNNNNFSRGGPFQQRQPQQQQEPGGRPQQQQRSPNNQYNNNNSPNRRPPNFMPYNNDRRSSQQQQQQQQQLHPNERRSTNNNFNNNGFGDRRPASVGGDRRGPGPGQRSPFQRPGSSPSQQHLGSRPGAAKPFMNTGTGSNSNNNTNTRQHQHSGQGQHQQHQHGGSNSVTTPNYDAQRRRKDSKGVSPALTGRTHWLFKAKDAAAAATAGNGQLPQHNTNAKGQYPPNSRQQQQQQNQKQQQPELDQVVIPEDVTVLRLASLLNISPHELEKTLTELGDAPRSEQEIVPPDSAELAALEYGRMAVFAAPSVVKKGKGKGNAAGTAVPRPPVVTVMGHVDHGKTSLLDALRSTSVAAKEAGGITQHIGAFEVALPGSKQTMTFIDTPGHAAFTAMRARGAAVTDIVVLVVAADDGIMPQTKEAMAHAQAAGCPIVVAITKCDLESANAERVRRQLMSEGLELEETGGNIQVIEVAATKGLGLEELEEAIILQSELLELKSDPHAAATGVVVEAKMDKGQGPSATVIVTRGTLRVGQAVVIGTEWGKVRALKGPGGGIIDSCLPGQPAEIIGLKGLPLAGDDLLAVVDEDRAQRVSKARTDRAEWRRRASLARLTNHVNEDGSELKMMPVVLKADVSGSVEAVKDALTSLSSDSVQVRVVHAGVGPVSLSDVQLAIPSGARVLGFNVKAPGAEVEAEAKRHNVQVVCRRIIYELLDDMAAAVLGAAPKERKEIVAGTAEILQMFPLTGKRGKKEVQQAVIAGCRVVEGSIRNSLAFRVMRGEEVVFEGPCASIRRQKLEVDNVGKGAECGVRLEGFNDFQTGDVLQCIDEIYA